MFCSVVFFKLAEKNWLSESALPIIPLKEFYIDSLPLVQKSTIIGEITGKIPVLFGEDNIYIKPELVDCGIDIFGSIFFMLSRYEEAVVKYRDKHGRFPATESIAFKAGFLHRAIVNEYVELLWTYIQFLWPNLNRKQRKFQMFPSHDVDSPFEDLFLSFSSMLRRFAGDIGKRKNFSLAAENYRRWKMVRDGELLIDRFNTFDFIMSESERRNIKSTFYFLPTGSKDLPVNPGIENPVVNGILREISDRGHILGLHGQYDTLDDKNLLKQDTEALKSILNKVGINQMQICVRQHYLRCDVPGSFRNWIYSGLHYDSTLGYADRPGFRCGTCYEYSLYDVEQRLPLNIVEKPLIAMECTVIANRYMGKGFGDEAFNIFKNLKEVCRLYNGNFTLLWHNSELVTPEQKNLYLSVLDA